MTNNNDDITHDLSFCTFLSLAEAHEWDRFLEKAAQQVDPDSLQEAYHTLLHWMSNPKRGVPCDDDDDDELLKAFLDLLASANKALVLTEPLLHEAIEAGVSARFFRKLVSVFPINNSANGNSGSRRMIDSYYDSEYQTPLDILCRKIIMSEERQKYAAAQHSDDTMILDKSSIDENLWECARIILVALISSASHTSNSTTAVGSSTAKPTTSSNNNSNNNNDPPLVVHAVVAAGSKCPESLRIRALGKFKSQLTVRDANGDLPIHICVGVVLPKPGDNLDDGDDDDASKELDDDDDDYLLELIQKAPQTLSMTNARNQIPLQLAVFIGRRWATGIDVLIQAHPLSLERLELRLALYPRIMAKCGSDVLYQVLREKPTVIAVYQ